MGVATRAALILAERFRHWPYGDPLTAAQVTLLAQALKPEDVSAAKPADGQNHSQPHKRTARDKAALAALRHQQQQAQQAEG